MTPMVDLAFLLLTFFVLASTLIKPKTIEIIFPDLHGDVTTPVNDKHAITLLLGSGHNEVCYYSGKFSFVADSLHRTDFSARGFRGVLFSRNAEVIAELQLLESAYAEGRLTADEYRLQYRGIVSSKNALVCIVKTCDDTPYEQVIAAMDELNICDVRKRVIQQMTEQEKQVLHQFVDSEKFEKASSPF